MERKGAKIGEPSFCIYWKNHFCNGIKWGEGEQDNPKIRANINMREIWRC